MHVGAIYFLAKKCTKIRAYIAGCVPPSSKPDLAARSENIVETSRSVSHKKAAAAATDLFFVFKLCSREIRLRD